MMQHAMARHDELLRDAVESHDGFIVKTTGDGFHAVFATAHDAVTAAVAAQRALLADDWNIAETVRVRMGIHTGEAEVRDGDYSGGAVNRAERLMSVAHGGQIVVSTATEELLHDALPEKYGFIDLGEHRLRDLGRPERLFQVTHPDLRREFPPLRSLDAFPGNLPVQLTSFVGREEELASVAELGRLVALVTADRGGRGRQDAPGVAGRGGVAAPVPGWCVVLRAGRRVSDEVLMGQVVADAVGASQRAGMSMADEHRRVPARPRSCCWCSTTVSTSSADAARARIERCCSVVRGCGCWRRAGRASGWRASSWWRCRRCRVPTCRRTPTPSTASEAMLACSSTGRWRRGRGSRWDLRTSRRSRRSVGVSTGSRWRSSSPRRGSRR